jgi:hypothetical protein
LGISLRYRGKLLQFSPIVCFDNIAVRWTIYFIVPVFIVTIGLFVLRQPYLSVIIAAVSGLLFLCLVAISNFASTNDMLLLEWLYIVPMQLLSGILTAAVLGGVASYIWSRFEESAVTAIKRLINPSPARALSQNGLITTAVSGGMVGVAGANDVNKGTQIISVTEDPKPPNLAIEAVTFDPNGPKEICIGFYLINPGKPTYHSELDTISD